MKRWCLLARAEKGLSQKREHPTGRLHSRGHQGAVYRGCVCRGIRLRRTEVSQGREGFLCFTKESDFFLRAMGPIQLFPGEGTEMVLFHFRKTLLAAARRVEWGATQERGKADKGPTRMAHGLERQGPVSDRAVHPQDCGTEGCGREGGADAQRTTAQSSQLPRTVSFPCTVLGCWPSICLHGVSGLGAPRGWVLGVTSRAQAGHQTCGYKGEDCKPGTRVGR